MRRTRERYRVDLLELQAACEANYLRLMRLLPEMRNRPDTRRIAMSQGDRLLGVLVLTVTESCPYTPPSRSVSRTVRPGCQCRRWTYVSTMMRVWLK